MFYFSSWLQTSIENILWIPVKILTRTMQAGQQEGNKRATTAKQFDTADYINYHQRKVTSQIGHDTNLSPVITARLIDLNAQGGNFFITADATAYNQQRTQSITKEAITLYLQCLVYRKKSNHSLSLSFRHSFHAVALTQYMRSDYDSDSQSHICLFHLNNYTQRSTTHAAQISSACLPLLTQYMEQDTTEIGQTSITSLPNPPQSAQQKCRTNEPNVKHVLTHSSSTYAAKCYITQTSQILSQEFTISCHLCL